MSSTETNQKTIRKPGQKRPAASAFFDPGPRLRNFSLRNPLKTKTLGPASHSLAYQTEGRHGRFLRSLPRRLGPGSSPQARPRREDLQLTTRIPVASPKPELSTLHKLGTFYFALTCEACFTPTAQNMVAP
jgi:hypothetical protein